jgi:hypothetical protein
VKSHREKIALVLLLGFVCVTLSINFFHSERSIKSDNACPACHYLASVFASAEIDFFCLPALIFLSTLDLRECFPVRDILLISPLSRSPPQA